MEDIYNDLMKDPGSWCNLIDNIVKRINCLRIVPTEKTEKGYYQSFIEEYGLLIGEAIGMWFDMMSRRMEASKDEGRAKKLKMEGNKLFQKKDYANSAKLYTESAQHAAHFENDELFSVAISNRSAALYHMNRYEDSLRDIEVARTCNYPKKDLWKLNVKAARCYIALGDNARFQEEIQKMQQFIDNSSSMVMSQTMKDAVVDKMKILMQDAKDMPKKADNVPVKKDQTDSSPHEILPKNDEFLFASSAIMVKRSASKGRYVVAKKNIKKEDVLFTEKPFAWVPIRMEQDDLLLCAHCCKNTRLDDYCIPGCSNATYCCWTCWKNSWSYHKWECAGHGMGIWQQIGIFYLAFRSLLSSVTTCDVAWFNSVQTLMSQVNRTPVIDVVAMSIGSLMLVIYLDKYTKFFDTIDIKQSLAQKFSDPSFNFDVDLSTRDGQKLYVGSILLRFSLQAKINAFVVTVNNGISDSTWIYDQYQYNQVVATGIYPSSSMMNHSCNPSTKRSFWRNWVIVRAARNIRKGDEVSNCYGPNYTVMDTPERQQKLLSTYHFLCQCEMCKE